MKSNETQRNTIVTKTACLCALLALGDILRNINPYIQVPSLAPKQKGLLRKSFLFWIASRDLKATVPTEGRQKRHGVTFLRRELHQPLLSNTPQQTS